MKLVHPYLERPIIFKENTINLLVIENPRLLSQFICELHEQINEGEGRFVLSSDLKQLEMKKNMDLVIDLFSLDFNQRKIINRIYDQLKKTAVEDDYYIESTTLISRIMEYLEIVLQTVQVPLEYDQDMDIVGIFKLANVKVTTNHTDLIEKLIDYMDLMQEFCAISSFIYVNLKCYLTDQEIGEFYKYSLYNKFNILLLENTLREKRFEEEIIRIIDNDMCEI